MASTYTGVAGNVTASASPTATIPADGDSLAVTSVNTALQKLTDYVAQIETGAGPSFNTYGATVPSAASTTYYLFVGVSNSLTNAQTAVNNGQCAVIVPVACVVRRIILSFANLTAGGPITASLYLGSGGSGVQANIQTVFPAGTASGTRQLTVVAPVAVSPFWSLQIQIANGAGVTTGLGLTQATMLVTLA